MNLTLAVAEACSPESCQVKLVNDGRSVTARYSALVLNRVKIRPGQLVAVDLDPAEPEIAWRWHRARVLETTPQGARVEDGRGHQMDAVLVPGLETGLSQGDEVWFTRDDTNAEWKIYAKIVNGQPEHPDRLNDLALPHITAALSNRSAV